MNRQWGRRWSKFSLLIAIMGLISIASSDNSPLDNTNSKRNLEATSSNIFEHDMHRGGKGKRNKGRKGTKGKGKGKGWYSKYKHYKPKPPPRPSPRPPSRPSSPPPTSSPTSQCVGNVQARCFRFCSTPIHGCDYKCQATHRFCLESGCKCHLETCYNFCANWKSLCKGHTRKYCRRNKARCGCRRKPPTGKAGKGKGKAGKGKGKRPKPPRPPPRPPPKCSKECKSFCSSPTKQCAFKPNCRKKRERCERQCGCRPISCKNLCAGLQENMKRTCQEQYPNGWKTGKCLKEADFCGCAGIKPDTDAPTFKPTPGPTQEPTQNPSNTPVSESVRPSASPSLGDIQFVPSEIPSHGPSLVPSTVPSAKPSALPSATSSLSQKPSGTPSGSPTFEGPQPSNKPSVVPSRRPSGQPTNTLSQVPSRIPSSGPSSKPTISNQVAPSNRPSVFVNETIFDVISSRNEFSVLTAAIEAANLIGPLSSPGNFTLFAPINEAFSPFPPEVLARFLNATWIEHLQDLLINHALGSIVDSSQLTNGLRLDTLREEELIIATPANLNPLVQTANLASAAQILADEDLIDFVATNGIVHGINDVLLADSAVFDIIQIAERMPNCSTFLELVQTAGLEDALKAPGPLTVFAPLNSAFAAFLAESGLSIADILADLDLLSFVLLNHIVKGNEYSSGLTDGKSLKSLAGQTLQITTPSDGVVQINGNATVVQADVLANNGIKHVINGVLLPNITAAPSNQPSSEPSHRPSLLPSLAPSRSPSRLPSFQPSGVPSLAPSRSPSRLPSFQPSGVPSRIPSASPSGLPSINPSNSPSEIPTSVPSSSAVPTESSEPSGIPSQSEAPSITTAPSFLPTGKPSDIPSLLPSLLPTVLPSVLPTNEPSALPSSEPSRIPSSDPSAMPSKDPTSEPTDSPSSMPSLEPSADPSSEPSFGPSSAPSQCYKLGEDCPTDFIECCQHPTDSEVEITCGPSSNFSTDSGNACCIDNKQKCDSSLAGCCDGKCSSFEDGDKCCIELNQECFALGALCCDDGGICTEEGDEFFCRNVTSTENGTN